MRVAPERTTPKLAFAFGDGKLLEYLAEILPEHIDNAAGVQAVLGKLRQRYSQGIETGNLGQLHSLVKNCRRCPALNGPCLPRGNLVNPDMVVVTDTPSTHTGLAQVLAEVGFDLSKIVLTSATRCLATPATRAPTTDEIDTCSGYLHGELALLGASLIVTMGNLAALPLLGAITISSCHGQMFWLGPHAVLPVYSLNYTIKNPARYQELLADLTVAYKFLY